MADAPKIAVLTASVRPEGLDMVADCLGRQTFRDFEWVVSVPAGTAVARDRLDHLAARVPALTFVHDPPRRPGDFYRLNGAWNKMVRRAPSPLLVFTCDWVWFPADALDLFWAFHREDPYAVVSSPGNRYRKVVNGRPEVEWASDVRLDWAGDDGRMRPEWHEMSVAAVPRALLAAVGGFDEDYDRVAANSEKEAALRMAQAGGRFYLATGVPHRIADHERLGPHGEWDRKYAAACEMMVRHAAEIEAGTRLKVPDLERT